MIRRKSAAREEVREAMRGGTGRGRLREIVAPGELAGVEFVSVVTLEPGASVGAHRHEGTEELYVVQEGRGTASLDGLEFPVEVGDAFLCRDGHEHGLANGPEGPLVFLAVLTKVGP